MSFEGFYQCVCKNGHYFEIDVYDDRNKCVDCFEDVIFKNTVDETNCEHFGYIRIPVDTNGDVEKEYFKKYFSNSDKIQSLKEKKHSLVSPYIFDFDKQSYPLEKIVELFKYFDQNKTLKIEFSMKRDQGNDLVPFVYVSFGDEQHSENFVEWKPMFIDDYGIETSENNGYECCLWSYDWDIRSIVIELYKNMWKRCFSYVLGELNEQY